MLCYRSVLLAPYPGRRDPDRFTLRPVDALREAYAQVMDELDLVKELLARLPTRREQAFTGSG